MKERRGKARCPRRGPREEVIPRSRAERLNINSKGNIRPVGGRGLLEGVEPSIGVVLS
jgi:hypothetical protein